MSAVAPACPTLLPGSHRVCSVLFARRQSAKHVAPRSASRLSPRCRDSKPRLTFRACASEMAPAGPTPFSSISSTVNTLEDFNNSATDDAPASDMLFALMSIFVTVVFDLRATAKSSAPFGPKSLPFRRILDKFNFGRRRDSARAEAPGSQVKECMSPDRLNSTCKQQGDLEHQVECSNGTSPILQLHLGPDVTTYITDITALHCNTR